MNFETINKSSLLVLVFIISAVFLSMIQQFLMAIFMAGLLSALLSPSHKKLCILLGNRENLSSMLIVAGIVLLILIPLAILITIVVAQAITVSQSIAPWIQKFIAEPTSMTYYLEKVPFYQEILPYRDTIIHKSGQLVGAISSFLIDSLGSFTKLTINFIFSSVIMLYVTFYFLNVGKDLLDKILFFLPLQDREEQKLLVRFTSVTRATIKGTIIIGILQGGICGISFAIAGIQGPFFWGTVMAVMSVIPAVGTAIIWGPALIIIALMSNFFGVAVLAIGCGLIAGNIDNFLRPRLVGKDTEMHDLFVLFGTLGGISMFGLLGIIIGPLIAALFLTLWQIYGEVFAAHLPKTGTSPK
ncbi:AI-2E family transporter [Desulfotalea psychrophila]|uniref:Conserved hypothetical membrane protein n=1 Tax=Desulfotalea psychrophila (strain LSv54 / DSM 12343) TaxID=177439 RepID=Q6ANW1_DESPS|nr:AI-2E family transporter [Desulfotalea psychrophila]CAG35963.1 conserved hypothetical membrane protein [Desulfotalea psychrophila LSv54]